MRQDIVDLEKVTEVRLHICHLTLLLQRCTDRAHTLVQSIEAIFKRIATEVAQAVAVVRIIINLRPKYKLTKDKAARRSPTVFENIAQTLKWNQYQALMRREGEYAARDLNMDLTTTILPSVQTQWHLGINVEIPALLSAFFQVYCLFLSGPSG
jgi:hypothetical protein